MDLTQTLFENFYQINKLHPTFKAINYLGKKISYQELFAFVNNIAHFFKSLDLKKDNFITLVAPNIPEAFYCFLAGEKLGLKVHLLHPLAGKNLVEEEIKDKNSKLFITADIFSKKYEDIIKVTPTLLLSPVDSLSFIKKTAFKLANLKNYTSEKCYHYHKIPHFNKEINTEHFNNKKGCVYLSSGGTTGKSKTIELSDYAILALLSQTYHILDKKIIDNHYMLSVLPMFHGFGLVMGILTPLFFNAKITMLPNFHTKPVIKLIKKNEINAMIGVPLIYEALLRNPKFNGPLLKNLYVSFVGGDFISPSLLSRFNTRMAENNSSCLLLEGYGLTETVTVCNVNTIDENREKSVGKPLPNVENFIIDEENNILPPEAIGEIVVTGETLMNGYYEGDSPFIEINDKKGVRTGDLGYLDKDGYLYFVSRKKNVISYKGFNIYPLGIEKKISLLPYIKEVSYFQLNDKIIVYLSLKENKDHEEVKKEVNKLIEDNFASYCLPNEICFLESLPYTNVGKIDVKELKRIHEEKAANYEVLV